MNIPGIGEITGVEDLAASFATAEAAIDAHVAPVVERTAERVKDTQRANVAVDSGRTRDSIAATGPNGVPFGPTVTDFEVGPTWFVGRLVELGTSRRGPRVFVANSLDPHIDQHGREVGAAAVALILDSP